MGAGSAAVALTQVVVLPCQTALIFYCWSTQERQQLCNKSSEWRLPYKFTSYPDTQGKTLSFIIC